MTEELGREQSAIWDQIAGFWDERVATSDDALLPVDLLLEITPDTTVLDIGCGNGRLARRAASLGAHVVAIDASRAFIEIARREASERIEYHVVDATDESELARIGERRFDVAVANMVLMNLSDIGPLARALARVMKPGGRFVASLPHPCFPWAMTVDVTDPRRKRTLTVRFFTLVDRIGALLPEPILKTAGRWWLRVMRLRDRPYLTPVARKMAAPGQPVPHYNFHRPLHVLLTPFFDVGFVVDALIEPLGIQAEPLEAETPGLLVFRLRLV